jgi:hypothetical protein
MQVTELSIPALLEARAIDMPWRAERERQFPLRISTTRYPPPGMEQRR